uniref:U3 small nucleolar RNA-associated protein 14 n=1 Tax=Anopheles atroparvus TaxID=41427 RepID=A0AAG5CU35_ANOAO
MPVEMKTSFPSGSAGGADDDEEEEIDPKAHEKLIDGINNLTGSHYIREVTRTEPSLKRSEFGLAKTKKDKVLLKDLSKFFKKNKKHTEVVKQLEKLKKRHPLRKPLEKPTADRLGREEGYKRAQKKLNKWEPLVTATDVAAQIVFPLRYGSMAVHNEPPKKLSEYRVKTKLMEEMEQLEKEYAGSGDEEEGASDEEGRKYKLTVEELRQKQYERSRQKRLESYQIAKGRRQNKIKSKKYHRLLKKDKLKEQMKKFEELKEKDPEEALKQLDRIEKQRFEERATLRHKNTGTWAKNLQVRAKYNMDVRRELSEQLAIGRELTAKRLQQDGSSSESDGEGETAIGKSGDNPWTERDMGEHEMALSQQQKLMSSYRKYWEERNRVQALKQQLAENAEDGHTEGLTENGEIVQDHVPEDDSEDEGEASQTKPSKSKKKGRKKEKETVRMASGSWDVEDDDAPIDEPQKKPAKSKAKSTKKQKSATATVEDLFQEAEELIQDALVNKLDRVEQDEMEEAQTHGTKRKGKPEGTEAKPKRDPTDLSFKKKPRLGDADEELRETIERDVTGGVQNAKALALNGLNAAGSATKASAEINLKQVVQMKPKHLLTALPNTITSGEMSDGEPEDDGDHQRLTIAEAFQDDDIVADFVKEKQDEREKYMPKEVDLSLPGWGEWAGPGVVPSKSRVQTRTFIKPPKELPRRDDRRDKVIINEDALVNPQLSKHLVNELPFPFVSVKDYESSLRAPLGRTFVPETAHVTMIEPRVVTKQGAVIEPMRKRMLMADQKGVRRRAPVRAGRKAVQTYNKFIDNFEKGKLPKKKFLDRK